MSGGVPGPGRGAPAIIEAAPGPDRPGTATLRDDLAALRGVLAGDGDDD
ncbi:hypothetical protein ABZ553_42060 [Streptomyces sparsogenes]